jgi:hypothetical protein
MNKLHHRVYAPAQDAHIVPQVQSSLLSTSKFVDANYIAVYIKQEVKYYNAKAKIIILEDAVLKGWQCLATGLWRVPLIEQPISLNTNTLLLDHPTKLENLNSLYDVTTTKKTREHIRTILGRTTEHINHVYELPSIEQTVRYLHAAAGHPTEELWLKAIDKGNYNSWLLINTKNVRKYFPELEETQLGHMRGSRGEVNKNKALLHRLHANHQNPRQEEK